MGTVHLIRHGQASWGAEDYDQLSELGQKQSTALGMSWEASDWSPTSTVAGAMKRHAQTAISAIDACGQGEGYEVDEDWNEFDHLAIARAHDPLALEADPKAFQAMLNSALDGWIAGGAAAGESYQQFVDRVMKAFDRVVLQASSGRSVAVFTSGGPIALVTSHLLTGGATLFQRVNDVVVNASVTTVIVGQSGPRLLTFNEHGHLSKDMVTFR